MPSLSAENTDFESIASVQQSNQHSETHSTDGTSTDPSTSANIRENIQQKQEPVAHIEATQTQPNTAQLACDQSSADTDETPSNAKSLSVEHLDTKSVDSNRHCTQRVQNEQNTTPTDEL